MSTLCAEGSHYFRRIDGTWTCINCGQTKTTTNEDEQEAAP